MTAEEYLDRHTGEVHDLTTLAGVGAALLAEQAAHTRTRNALDRLRDDLDDLRHQLTDLTADTPTRDAAADHHAAIPSGAVPPRPRAGDHNPADLQRQVQQWVGWLRHRYPIAHQLPPCWAQHSELVEELTALHLAWRAAYTDPAATPTAAADFHTHYLPAALDHVHGWGVHCTDTHRPRSTGVYAEPPGPDGDTSAPSRPEPVFAAAPFGPTARSRKE
jgi:hypothetical protein